MSKHKDFSYAIALLAVIVFLVGAFLINTLQTRADEPGREAPVNNSNREIKRIVLLGASPVIQTTFAGLKSKLNQLVSMDDDLEIEYIDLDIPYSEVNMQNAVNYILNADVDLVVTGQGEVKYLRDKIRIIPIIVALASDPVESGLAVSEAGSGNNFVFIDTGASANASKRLTFFLELMPEAKNILVIRGADFLDDTGPLGIENLRQEAIKRQINLIDKQFSTRQELNKFFLEYDFSQVDAIYRHQGGFNAANADLFFAFQPKLKKPIITIANQELEAGGILAYGPKYDEFGEVGASIAWQILKGQADPATIPINRPFRNAIGFNERVAKELGIIIPTSLLIKADYVIN